MACIVDEVAHLFLTPVARLQQKSHSKIIRIPMILSTHCSTYKVYVCLTSLTPSHCIATICQYLWFDRLLHIQWCAVIRTISKFSSFATGTLATNICGICIFPFSCCELFQSFLTFSCGSWGNIEIVSHINPTNWVPHHSELSHRLKAIRYFAIEHIHKNRILNRHSKGWWTGCCCWNCKSRH